MSHRWKYGSEYQKLSDAMRKARREGDDASIKRIKPRLDELNEMMWKSLTNSFPELTPYFSLAEAIEQLCIKSGLPFPDLNDKEHHFTGKGNWKEVNRFIFGVGNHKRSIQIFPMEDRRYIDVELYEAEFCYKGQTSSILESAVVFSKWYMQELSIGDLHQQFRWISYEPLKLSGPRATYK